MSSLVRKDSRKCRAQFWCVQEEARGARAMPPKKFFSGALAGGAISVSTRISRRAASTSGNVTEWVLMYPGWREFRLALSLHILWTLYSQKQWGGVEQSWCSVPISPVLTQHLLTPTIMFAQHRLRGTSMTPLAQLFALQLLARRRWWIGYQDKLDRSAKLG